MRQNLVDRAKRLLAQGYYDNTHVLAFAVARMLDEALARPPRPRTAGVIPGRQARAGEDRRPALEPARRR